MSAGFASNDAAMLFMVAAELVFAIIAACCSSPQTAEINAGQRAATLMKYVWIGVAVAALFILIAALWLDEAHWPTLFGGGLAGAIMGVLYVYAKRTGLRSGLPGTEA